MAEGALARSFDHLGLPKGTPVIVYLQNPKEKVFGLLIALETAGVVVFGLDLVTFEDWMRQEARRAEAEIGPVTLFYPMHRIERVEKDATVGSVPGYADRFAREVGRTVEQVLDLESGQE